MKYLILLLFILKPIESLSL